MKSPAIPEIEPQFEKEIDIFQHPLQQPFQVYVIRWETPTMQARLRSSIFEETLTPDPSPCRWLLDIISEDKHMVKISIHFVLSENQLILVVDYTFDVHKSQVQLSMEYERYCGRFCCYSTQTLNEILIGNVNIKKLDIEKVNLLKDSYKICLQKMRKTTSNQDLREITSKIISAVSEGLITILNNF